MILSKAVELFAFRSGAALTPATASLDAEIRQLVKSSRMPSPYIELDYQTEPSFFAALAPFGHRHDLVLIRPPDFDGLAGLGVRSVRRAFVGGREVELGYLHHLRFHPDIRGGSYLARGYKALRQAFNATPLPATLTSILEDNSAARHILENNRAGGVMPSYQKISRFLTALIPLRGPGQRWPVKHRHAVPGVYRSRRLTQGDMPRLVKLFAEAGRCNDGATIFTAGDFCGGLGSMLPGMQISNVIGIFSGNDLLAATGIWNQQQYRQIILSHLCSPLLNIQRIWQAGSRLWGQCPVPSIGEPVDSVLLDPWAVAPGLELELMPTLLMAAVREARQLGALFAAFGVAEKNPAINSVRTVFFLPYWSIIYQVQWPETGIYDFGGQQMQLSNLGAL